MFRSALTSGLLSRETPVRKWVGHARNRADNITRRSSVQHSSKRCRGTSRCSDHVAPSKWQVAFASANLLNFSRARQPTILASKLLRMLQYIGRLHNFQRVLASDKYWLVPPSYRTTTAQKRFLNGCIPIRCFRAGTTGCHWFRQSGQEFYQSRRRTATGRPYDCISHCSFAQPHQPLPVSRKSTRTSLRHHIVRTPASVLRAWHLSFV
jgi:hypothetical protein